MDSKLKKIKQLSISDRILYFRIFVLSMYFRFRVKHTAFAKLAEKMGVLNQENLNELKQDQKAYSRKLEKAIVQVSNHTLWESKCLVQALIMQKLFKEKDMPYTLYLGLTKNKENVTTAHAWIKCGGDVVIGGNKIDQYAIIAKFGSRDIDV